MAGTLAGTRKTNNRLSILTMEHLNYFTFLNNRLSIQKFLSICLIGLITCSICILGFLNYARMKHQNEDLFQMQMVNSANAIDALLAAALGDNSKRQLAKLLQSDSLSTLSKIRENLKPKVALFDNVYHDSFAFEVYDRKTKNLLLHSSGSPKLPTAMLDNDRVFQNITVETADGDKTWNTFIIKSHYRPYRIVVMISSDYKEAMFLNLFESTLWDLIVLYVFLLLSVFIVVQLALRPLSDMRRAIAVKNPRKLEPIAVKTAPPEIIPLLNQLNILFRKFNDVLEREKRFAGDAAHELKTPLAALKTQAEIALNLNHISQIKGKIRNIIEGADRYFYIIDRLLTLSRIEPQQDLPDKKLVNLNTIAEVALANLAMSALDKNIELSFMPSKKEATIYGSEALLGILFRNLTDNAIRYTPEGGKVSLYSYVTETHVIFEVIDNGIGVAETKLDRIFDRFYREAGSGQSGSGLGLSIVREIVRLHDAKVSAKLPSDHQGLCIELQFRHT